MGHEGYVARIERAGPAALRQEREWQPELVLLDLGLPTLNGFDVCRRLRSASRMPIVVIKAREAIEDRVRGLDAGADDYVIKPYRWTSSSLACGRTYAAHACGRKEHAFTLAT